MSTSRSRMVAIGDVGRPEAPDPVASAAMRLRERAVRKVDASLRDRMLAKHDGSLADVIGCDACCRTASEYLDASGVTP